MVSFSKNKYGSRKKKNKPTMDGFVFDSTSEINRYCELKMMLMKCLICDLEVHPEFILSEGIKNDHGQHVSKWRYTADFKYFDKEKQCDVVEDVKSIRIDKNGKKHGTSQSRDYKLTRNEFMRQNPDILFREIY